MHASWPQLLLLVFAWRRGSMGFGCPLHSIPWPSTYPTRPSSFPPCWDTRVSGMWVICQGNPTPTCHACVSARKHEYAPGAFSWNLSDYVASPGDPRRVSGCVSTAHTGRFALDAGAPWSRQPEPAISLMWRACRTTPRSICAPLP